jgi:hypothetical protein
VDSLGFACHSRARKCLWDLLERRERLAPRIWTSLAGVFKYQSFGKMGLDGGTKITRSDVLRGASWRLATADGSKSTRGGAISTTALLKVRIP